MAQQLKIDITVCAMSSDAENIVDISCWERLLKMTWVRRLCGSVLFTLVLSCGVISSVSLLLLLTPSIHYSSSSQVCLLQSISISAMNFILISLGALEIFNLVKNLVLWYRSHNSTRPSFLIIIWTLLSEAISMLGLCVLLFYTLPRLDVIRGCALLTASGFTPTLAKLILSDNKLEPNKACLCRRLLLGASMTAQFIALIIIYLHNFLSASYTGNDNLTSSRAEVERRYTNATDMLAVIIPVLTIPMAWVDNYISCNKTVCGRKLDLLTLKKNIDSSRLRLRLFVPLWKAVCLFVFLYLWAPDYINRDCSDKSALQQHVEIQSNRSALEEQLTLDERTQNLAMTTPSPEHMTWEEREILFNDSKWLPPKLRKQPNMVPTQKVMELLDDFIDSIHSDNKTQFKLARMRMNTVILEGRYTNKTKETYKKLYGLLMEANMHVDHDEMAAFVEYYETTHKFLAVVLVCSTLICLISVKAACHWDLTLVGYVVAISLVPLVTYIFLADQCYSPSALLAPLMRCAEPPTAASLTVIYIAATWYLSLLLILVSAYQSNPARLDISIDLSMLLILPLCFTANTARVTAQDRRSADSKILGRGKYKFEYIQKHTEQDTPT